MNEESQSFGDARKDAMSDADRDARPLRFDSPNAIDARSSHGSAQIVQVETLGRLGLFVILAMFLVIVALAFYTGRTDGLGEARAENMATDIRRLNAKVEVIQWEFDKASAQLIEKGLITPTE